MKGLTALFLGILGTFAFSWVGLTMIPNAQIGNLEPQMDEDGNDPYPAPKSGMADRGRQVYVGNGCIYCHSQQVRPSYGGSDIDRKWGERRSAPRDYLFERPALLGKMRMGPDLSNIGKRAPVDDENAPPPASTDSTAAAPAPPAPGAGTAPPATANPETPATASGAAPPSPAAGSASPAPVVAAQTAPAVATPSGPAISGEPLQYSAEWHHRHLYDPRSMTLDSTMPAYRFLYEKRKIGGQASTDALKLDDHKAPPEGYEIVPTYDAKCLVAYLMSLDQSHALNEVKSNTPVSPQAPGTAVK